MKKTIVFEFEPIGYLKTDFKQKFGIPRQAGLIKSTRSILKLRSGAEFISALKGIEGFSHLWILFVFHDTGTAKWKPTIRPPRLGGAKRVGVLASRSPHRPNPIGLSIAEIDRIDLEAKNGAEIHLKGLDILDGTPVLDIKPYLAYADAITDARAGWAAEEIDRNEVRFSERAEREIEEITAKGVPHFRDLVTEMLELDPRPAFQQRRVDGSGRSGQANLEEEFGFLILDYDVQWSPRSGHFFVHRVIPASESAKALKRNKRSASS